MSFCLWRRFASSLSGRQPPPFLVLSEEVEHALHSNLPLVAFESTIATHGLPAELAVSVPLCMLVCA